MTLGMCHLHKVFKRYKKLLYMPKFKSLPKIVYADVQCTRCWEFWFTHASFITHEANSAIANSAMYILCQALEKPWMRLLASN